MIYSKLLISANEYLQSYQISGLCNVTVGQNIKNWIKKMLEMKILKMGLNVHIYEEFLSFLELKTDLRINFF